MRRLEQLLVVLIVASAWAAALAWQQKSGAQSVPILEYIKANWAVLTRSNRTLAASAVDPKFQAEPGGRWPMYVSRKEDRDRIQAQLDRELSPADLRIVDLRVLPRDDAHLQEPGLLYLPYPYVVPGGRFNEMYGWDSYFIQAGLLHDNLVGLAKDMAGNFLYEIREYGKILNANRSYYLTRSQPPFLTQMLLAVYSRTNDRAWLAAAVPSIQQYYEYWTREPHLTPATGLSRYFDTGEGPSPEVVASERDPRGHTHYELVKSYFRAHPGDLDDLSRYYDAAHDQLTAEFYKGDRSMRESGFDPSSRFGPFSVEIVHYNPVCLNSLLYLMEEETSQILQILGRPADADVWKKRAQDRAELINRLLWDEKDGLYFDYNFDRRALRRYPFLSTFYPLWAGIATQAQAARVAANLPLFERPGGLQTSTRQSGDQWDAPFGWAPLQMIAIEGLRRYGYIADADRLSGKFLSLVAEQYRLHGAIVEKYDVVRRSMELNREIRFGYHTNEAGFGWTNAVFTRLLDALPPAQRETVLRR